MNVATVPISEILLAGPRGFCAGVERAIDIVELALSVCRPPVYVRREIVHNRHVVESLRAKGAVFVDELAEVPNDADDPTAVLDDLWVDQFPPVPLQPRQGGRVVAAHEDGGTHHSCGADRT